MKSIEVDDGYVNDPSYSYTVNGVTWSDLIRMQMYALPGDSGGPLVSPAVSTITYRTVYGILEGTDTIYTNFVKATSILSSMNGSLY